VQIRQKLLTEQVNRRYHTLFKIINTQHETAEDYMKRNHEDFKNEFEFVFGVEFSGVDGIKKLAGNAGSDSWW
jgi:hypothetical protein